MIGKCRAWDNVENKWVNGFAVSQEGGMIITEMGSSIRINENVIIEYFTGLSDKNGNDVYEGDILSYENEDKVYWKVAWDEHKIDLPTGFVFGMFGMEASYPQYMHPSVDRLVIKGNIHEGKYAEASQ